jgi:tetratricopeptide (TPR) repeat protein
VFLLCLLALGIHEPLRPGFPVLGLGLAVLLFGANWWRDSRKPSIAEQVRPLTKPIADGVREANQKLDALSKKFGKLESLLSPPATDEEIKNAIGKSAKEVGQDVLRVLAEIENLLHQNQIDDAARRIHALSVLFPDVPELHHNLGYYYLLRRRPDLAISECKTALHLNDNAPDTLNNLGAAYLEVGDPVMAEVTFKRLLGSIPNDIRARFNLGVTLFFQSKFKASAQEFRVILGQEPGFQQAHCALGTALLHLRKHADAADALKRAIGLNESDSLAWLNLGVVYMAIDRYEDALGAFGRAMRIRPSWAEAVHNYGTALESIKKNDEAIEHYQKALDLDKTYFLPHYSLVRIYATLGRLQEARHHLLELRRMTDGFGRRETSSLVSDAEKRIAAAERHHS